MTNPYNVIIESIVTILKETKQTPIEVDAVSNELSQNVTLEVAAKMKNVTDPLKEIVNEFNVVDTGANEILEMAKLNVEASEIVMVAAEQQAATMEELNSSKHSLASKGNNLSQSIQYFKI